MRLPKGVKEITVCGAVGTIFTLYLSLQKAILYHVSLGYKAGFPSQEVCFFQARYCSNLDHCTQTILPNSQDTGLNCTATTGHKIHIIVWITSDYSQK